MNDSEINDLLRRAADAPHEVDPAVLERISSSIGPPLRPVSPMPASWVLASVLFLICAVVATTGAALLKFNGIRNLGGSDIAIIFPVLGALMWVAAMSSAREVTPGSARRLTAVWSTIIGTVALLALFAGLFHDYHVDRFVPRGLVCLTAGLADAIVAGFAGYFVLRRGFAVRLFAAGLATGAMAGFAGVTMLELHCANFQALHILVWHTAVLPLSGFAGALVATAGGLFFGDAPRDSPAA